ncbi:hypothetical protein DEO72_LG4g1182 [Vigna unguiculata]|uniref:Uncharacterized protein n=1 Tax=Vigna unguiculata TaxID=3917 RepID=A0A4D6LNV0_VIGUN|nr:hypothetical protein DEO72_LG4g1182 [Vigna unguiculata]
MISSHGFFYFSTVLGSLHHHVTASKCHRTATYNTNRRRYEKIKKDRSRSEQISNNIIVETRRSRKIVEADLNEDLSRSEDQGRLKQTKADQSISKQ